MDISLSLLLIAAFTLNIPFGYWRQGLPRFSALWFLAIHTPVPLVILLRIVFDIGLFIIPVTLTLSILGQIIGGKLRDRVLGNGQIPAK